MKINKSKFLSLILLFSLVFSSLAISADNDNSTKHDYEVTIGDYKYFSDKKDDYKLKKVELNNDSEEIADTVKDITTTGSAIHLVTNYNESDPKDEDKYFYYCLIEPKEDDKETNPSIYKFDTTDDSVDYTPSKINIECIDDIDSICFPEVMISEMVLTKNSVGEDVIFFIEPGPDSKKGLLCKLTISNDNKGTLNIDFKYGNKDAIVEAKDIYIKDDFLHFTHFISIDDEKGTPRKLDINSMEITDILLDSIEIKRKSSSGDLEKITNGILNIHKGDEVTLAAYMDPEPTNKDLMWEAQENKNSDGKDILKDLESNIDSTEYSFKVSEEANIGDITNIVVFDKISNKLASINIVIEEEKNPLKEIKLNTSSLQEIPVLEKGESLEIPIIFIGEDASKNITNINEIKNKVKASSNEYIGTEIITDKDNNKLLKITAKKITPEGSGSKAEITIDIEEYKDIKVESPSIIVKEIIKPNIKIQPIGLADNVDITKPVELIKGKTLDFELLIEKDGKFEKIGDSESEKITWSTQSIESKDIVSIDPSKGTKTKITALGVGNTSLTATYKYDGAKTIDCKIDLTVIADEYGEYDKWTDEKTPTTVSPTKIWSVKFNNSIDEDSINGRSIYVKKRIAPNVEVLFDDTITYVGDNDKTINIKPTRSYDSGEYFLYIESIKDIYGRKLNKNLKVKFTVR